MPTGSSRSQGRGRAHPAGGARLPRQGSGRFEGEADRFTKIYQQYKLAPDVTRKRMFLETMERVLSDTDKVIVDEKAGSGVGRDRPLPEFTKGAQAGRGERAINRSALHSSARPPRIVAGLVAYLTLFTVDQTQQALVLESASRACEILTTGLHYKVPFIQNVEYFDKRILDIDTALTKRSSPLIRSASSWTPLRVTASPIPCCSLQSVRDGSHRPNSRLGAIPRSLA